MKKSGVISVVAIISALAFIVVSGWVFFNREKVIDNFSRGYRNYFGSFERQRTIESYAGCQMRTMTGDETDEDFSKIWPKYPNELNFDAIDVDRYMLKHCPPRTSEETIAFWNEYFKDKNYSDMDEEKERQVLTEKSIIMSKYKRKFLSREFTALKNEPRE